MSDESDPARGGKAAGTGMNYVQFMRRPARYVPIVVAVLVIHAVMLWVLLQWQVYTPTPWDGLIRVNIYAPKK
jgi:hypothetical protein